MLITDLLKICMQKHVPNILRLCCTQDVPGGSISSYTKQAGDCAQSEKRYLT